jgi:hypothetical protein
VAKNIEINDIGNNSGNSDVHLFDMQAQSKIVTNNTINSDDKYKDLIIFLDLVCAMMRDALYELAASVYYDVWRG